MTSSVSRILVLSDAHGRADRVDLCLRGARSHAVDEVWSLGDTVDAFGAATTADVDRAVDAVDSGCTLRLGGNHEQIALRAGGLSPVAAQTVEQWPARAQRAGVLCVHGGARDPRNEFCDNEPSAEAMFDLLGGWLGLFGHTHQPQLWTFDGRSTMASAPKIGEIVTVAPGHLALACPGALTGSAPTCLLVDLPSRSLVWQHVR